MTTPLRIAINGFGRIGRTVLRQILTAQDRHDIEVVAINDIAPLDTCAYLFKYDSVYGPCPLAVEISKGRLMVGDTSIPFTQSTDLHDTDLNGVDVLMECTGRATTRAVAEAGLDAGARAVLISGPSAAADVTVVMGANDGDLGDATIVSNALEAFVRDIASNPAIIGTTQDPCVSTDMRARPESLVIASRETMVIDDKQLRLFGWYDNEWGFSARMIDMAHKMAARN